VRPGTGREAKWLKRGHFELATKRKTLQNIADIQRRKFKMIGAATK